MLEIAPHQASGLLKIKNTHATRFIAIVKHADAEFELPLLWRLCASLVELGHTVTVLDTTTAESHTQPGLEQLLDNDFFHAIANFQAQGWNIIPAATGLQTLAALAQQQAQALHCLNQLFADAGIVVVYGPSDCLNTLFAHHRIHPLLAVAAARKYLLSSYGALKHLLLHGGLKPLIVNVTQGVFAANKDPAPDMLAALSKCVQTFLGYEAKIAHTSVQLASPDAGQTLQALALRILEDALTLERAAPIFTPHVHRHETDYLEGSF